MCIKCEAIFKNKYFTERSKIIFHDRKCHHYVSPITLKDIVVEIDDFEILTISSNEYCNHKNLCKFDYEIIQGLYEVKNYELKIFIPIKIVENKSKMESMTEIIVELKNENKKYSQELKIMDTEITLNEWAYANAFEKIYDQIKDKYMIKICACCKKSHWNPYGGSDFMNQLCFRDSFDEYNEIEIKDKTTVGKLMAVNNNFQNVLLTDCCKEYEEK